MKRTIARRMSLLALVLHVLFTSATAVGQAAPWSQSTPDLTIDEKAIWTQLEQIRATDPTHYDEFRRNRGEWHEVDNAVKRYAYHNRAYHLTIHSDNRVAWSVNSAIATLAPADYLVEVDAALVDGPHDGEYGLVFRYVDDQNFYQFTLSAGQYKLTKLIEGEWETILPWTAVDGLAEPTAVNRLGVLAQGSTLTLLINNLPVAQTTDESFRAGGVGVVAGSFAEGGVGIAFDNLDFWSLSAAEVPTIAPEQPPLHPTPVASQSWTTYTGAAFTLAHPTAWRVTQSEEGQIAVNGPQGEVLVIWPTFVQGDVSTALAGTILTEFAARRDVSMSWSRPRPLAENALTISGTNATQTAVASITWVNSSQGAAPTFYLLSAPTTTFASLEATFVHILESFQIIGAPLAESPVRPTYQFVAWQDPVERAFRTEVPAGWQVEGGLYRAAAVDVRPWLRLTSPDGGIQVFAGDQRIPPFTLPDQTLTWLGISEGQWYSPGYGVQMLVSRYLPGEEFAASYLAEVMELSGCVIDEMGPLLELEAALQGVAQEQGMGFVTQQNDVGEVRFTCQDGQETLKGYLIAHTTMLAQSGSGIWNLAMLGGYVATPTQEIDAQAILGHLAQSWQINPQWAAMQQGTTAAVSDIVSATSSAIADTINSTFAAAQASQDRLSQAWADTLRAVERVQDGRTGQVYEVLSGSHYHWIDAQGNIVGTDAHFNPDGLRFEEMVRVP